MYKVAIIQYPFFSNKLSDFETKMIVEPTIMQAKKVSLISTTLIRETFLY